MKKLLLILLFLPMIGFGQIEYELDFNSNTNDYVEIINASAVIANKTSFSISGWVKPQLDGSHSGLFGFRNNTDADFYLLQLQNTSNIEARFRNSAGIAYDIIAMNGLDFNQWQHLAFTYDGSYIRLYKNGVLLDSTSASGTITQTNQSFRLGSLDWQGTGFYMLGRLDEIRLWDVALSALEINNWMCIPIDLSHPHYSNLMGYWRLNDGQGIVASDQINGNNGTLMNGTVWYNATSCFGPISQPLTYVPDDNFESYLEANGMGDGILLNDSVLTVNINTVTHLFVPGMNISDLTGVEDFSALTHLMCDVNQLTSLDLTQNTALTYLECWSNQLTYLDVSQNLALDVLWCEDNQLTSLDVSNNTNLTNLSCFSNQLTYLDVSNNTFLDYLECSFNQLTSLDVSQNINLESLGIEDNQITSLDLSQNNLLTYLGCGYNHLIFLDLRNGNNINTVLWAVNNPELTCINVDDSLWSTNNWTVVNLSIDPQQYFSENCVGTTIVQDYKNNKEVLKITDILGRQTKHTNQPLFYLYDDGTIEKRIIIE